MVQVIRGSDDPELFNLDPQDEERLIYGNSGDESSTSSGTTMN
jgi:hypothetical protein